MPDLMRVGIIGPVSSYTLHSGGALSKMEGVEFVGVAHLDRDPKYIKAALNMHWLAKYPKTIEGFKAAWGGEIYERADELIEKGKPDAVCICTEDYLHQHYALLALDKGVHVFLPKPFASTRAEGEAVFAAANEKGLICMGSLPQHFRAFSHVASKLIDEGAIGRPISGHFAITHHLTLGAWKADPTMAAGPEFEIGFYVFDLMRMLMKSEPASVTAYADNLDHRGIPYIDTGKCMIRCENGALATVDLLFSMHHPFPPGRAWYVVGDEGAMTMGQDPSTGAEAIVIHTPDGVEYRTFENYDAVSLELGTWLDLCREKGDPTWWQMEGLRTLDLVCAFKEAYQCGGTVTLPPTTAQE